MKHKERLFFLLIMILGLAENGIARNSDSTLGLIRTPNNGIPVMVSGKADFDVILEEEAILHLSCSGNSFPLDVAWQPQPGGLFLGSCNSATPLPPGAYTLQAETQSRTDSNLRCVYIFESFPETYHIAHVTDTHIGTARHPRKDSDIILDIFEAVNASDACFVLITGDLTENGEPEQFRRFIEILDMCRIPTYVVPGNHDRQDRNYQRFFSPMVYAFRFGQDGYLGFDTKDYLVADEMDLQNGLLNFYRRQLRSSRWSIGFTHRYDLTMGLHAQLCLFVDDPLDYLVYGHTHREAGEQDGIPWGQTKIIMTPAAIDGQIRFLNVDANGVKASETLSAAVTGVQGE
jgi:predicted phosphodiesterase